VREVSERLFIFILYYLCGESACSALEKTRVPSWCLPWNSTYKAGKRTPSSRKKSLSLSGAHRKTITARAQNFILFNVITLKVLFSKIMIKTNLLLRKVYLRQTMVKLTPLWVMYFF
jgi:hypothetical protein